MKFPRNTKVELCVEKGERARAFLVHPFLDLSDRERPMLAASDGAKLIVVPVEVGPEDVTGFVSVDALVAARKARKPYLGDPEVVCGAEWLTVEGYGQFPRPKVEGVFPSWRDYVSTARDQGAPTVRVCLNSRLLADCAKAAAQEGNGVVSVEFAVDPNGQCRTDGLAPLRVEVSEASAGTIVVLMPGKDDPSPPLVDRGTVEAPAPRRRRLKWTETCADCDHKPHDGTKCVAKDCECEAPTWDRARGAANFARFIPEVVELRAEKLRPDSYRDVEDGLWVSFVDPAAEDSCTRCGAKKLHRGYAYCGNNLRVRLCPSHVRALPYEEKSEAVV